MPRTHPPYPAEFRRQMVELVRSGRAIRELAREFECSDPTIRNWVRQTDLDEGRRDDGLTSEEREELPRGSSPRATASSDGHRSCARRISHLWSTTRGSSSCPGSRSPTSARTSSPSSAGACPRTGPSATTRTPRSSRPLSRPRATPAPSTGHRAGSTSEPPRDADATTGTDTTTSPRRTSDCGPCGETGNKSSIAETTAITPRLNAYRQGLAGMRRRFNESAFILITDYGMRVPDESRKICIIH